MEKTHDILHYLAQVAPYLPFPIYWMDLEGRMAGANQAYLDTLGIKQVDQVIGKTPFEFFADDVAKGMVDHANLVIETKRSQTREDVVRDEATGKKRYYSAVRSPLSGPGGHVFGVIGTAIDVTAERENRKLQEHNRELSDITEKEAFAQMARKVAHDIQSPLTALSVMVNVCDELNESKRLILKNTFTAIKDIANNILNRYSRDEHHAADVEEHKLILCSDFLMKLISERKYQYQDIAVKFDVNIAQNAQFSFIQAQSSQLGRAITNLISNAVDALKGRPNAKISIKLEVDEVMVKFTVQDNGKGMGRAMVEKILNHTKFTEGKENGHGLGMMQVWEMVENNDGSLMVQSEPGRGTTFELTFGKIGKADWIMEEIIFNSNDIVVILDDDQLIHDAWDLRLNALQNSMPDLIVRHEKQGQAVLDYLDALSHDDRDRVYLLCDFELINQNRHGLQIIEASNLKRAVLVTSYYANPVLQKSVAQMNIKILPKQMASIVAISCAHQYGILKLNSTDIMYDKNYYAIDQARDRYAV